MSWLKIIFVTHMYVMSSIFQQMLGPWKQYRIKVLPDVGMVKVYPKCVLKAANVDRVVTLSRNTSLLLDFSTRLFVHATTSSIRDTIHHPYISTCFCGILYSTIGAQQTNLLPENASENNAIFPKSWYGIYQTTSQWLSSYGCAIIVLYR